MPKAARRSPARHAKRVRTAWAPVALVRLLCIKVCPSAKTAHPTEEVRKGGNAPAAATAGALPLPDLFLFTKLPLHLQSLSGLLRNARRRLGNAGTHRRALSSSSSARTFRR